MCLSLVDDTDRLCHVPGKDRYGIIMGLNYSYCRAYKTVHVHMQWDLSIAMGHKKVVYLRRSKSHGNHKHYETALYTENLDGHYGQLSLSVPHYRSYLLSSIFPLAVYNVMC